MGLIPGLERSLEKEMANTPWSHKSQTQLSDSTIHSVLLIFIIDVEIHQILFQFASEITVFFSL